MKRTWVVLVAAAVLAAAATGGPAGPSAVAAAGAHATPPACRWSNLFANVLWAQVNNGLPGGGAVQGRIAFDRKGSQACSLSGWVTATILNRSGRALPVTETRLGTSEKVGSFSVRKPGHGSVIAPVTWLNWCKGKIAGPITLRVKLPHGGGTQTLSINQLGFVGVMTPSCVNPKASSGLQIGSFRKGP